LGAGLCTRNRRIGHLLSAAVRLSSPQPSPRRRHLATATAAIAAARFVLLVGQTSKRCSGEVMSARRPAAASPQAPPRHRHRLDRNSAVRATVGQTSKRCSGEVMSARRPAAASPQPPPPPRRNLIKGHLTLAFDLNRSPLQQKKLRVRDPARPRALLLEPGSSTTTSSGENNHFVDVETMICFFFSSPLLNQFLAQKHRVRCRRNELKELLSQPKRIVLLTRIR
jgi:hypothetical protein